MANDYIEVLFKKLEINEIDKIISSIDYNVDDITNCYYFFLSNIGKRMKPVTVSRQLIQRSFISGMDTAR